MTKNIQFVFGLLFVLNLGLLGCSGTKKTQKPEASPESPASPTTASDKLEIHFPGGSTTKARLIQFLQTGTSLNDKVYEQSSEQEDRFQIVRLGDVLWDSAQKATQIVDEKSGQEILPALNTEIENKIFFIRHILASKASVSLAKDMQTWIDQLRTILGLEPLALTTPTMSNSSQDNSADNNSVRGMPPVVSAPAPDAKSSGNRSQKMTPVQATSAAPTTSTSAPAAPSVAPSPTPTPINPEPSEVQPTAPAPAPVPVQSKDNTSGGVQSENPNLSGVEAPANSNISLNSIRDPAVRIYGFVVQQSYAAKYETELNTYKLVARFLGEVANSGDLSVELVAKTADAMRAMSAATTNMLPDIQESAKAHVKGAEETVQDANTLIKITESIVRSIDESSQKAKK